MYRTFRVAAFAFFIIMTGLITSKTVSPKTALALCGTDCGWTGTQCGVAECKAYEVGGCGWSNYTGVWQCYCIYVDGCSANGCWPESCGATGASVQAARGCCGCTPTCNSPLCGQSDGCGGNCANSSNVWTDTGNRICGLGCGTQSCTKEQYNPCLGYQWVPDGSTCNECGPYGSPSCGSWTQTYDCRSPVTNCTVCSTPNPAPQPASPADGTTLMYTTSTTLSWTATTNWAYACPSNNNRYYVYVSTTNPPPQVSPKCNVAAGTTSCSVTGLVEGSPYYWQIVATNGSTSVSSSIWSFSVVTNETWFQTSGSDVHVNDGGVATAIQSLIPAQASPKTFIKDLTSYPGVLSLAAGSVNLGVDGATVSSKNWQAATSYADKTYNYDSVQHLISGIQTLGTNLGTGELAALASGSYQVTGGTGDLNLDGVQNVSGKKIVILVPRDLILGPNTQISLASEKGTETVVFIVGRNIIIDPDVTGTEASPALEGIYIASGTVSTGTKGVDQDARLVVRGTVIGYGGINLQRDLPQASERTTPAELFIYRPDQLLAIPSPWARRLTRTAPVAP